MESPVASCLQAISDPVSATRFRYCLNWRHASRCHVPLHSAPRLLDRLTRDCEIVDTGDERWSFRQRSKDRSGPEASLCAPPENRKSSPGLSPERGEARPGDGTKCAPRNPAYLGSKRMLICRCEQTVPPLVRAETADSILERLERLSARICGMKHRAAVSKLQAKESPAAHIARRGRVGSPRISRKRQDPDQSVLTAPKLPIMPPHFSTLASPCKYQYPAVSMFSKLPSLGP